LISSALLIVVTRNVASWAGGHTPYAVAVKAVLEDGAVDLAQIGRARFDFDTYNDAVGMKEVFDSVAFAEKLWIRGHTEKFLLPRPVSDEHTLQLEAGARGNGAFLDHELGRTGLLGDLSGDVLNAERSASPLSFGGVPTQMKMTVSGADGPRQRLPCRRCVRPCERKQGFRRGTASKIDTTPAFRRAMRSLSMSVQVTSCPAAARHAPVTSPT